jgi:hypothetical protein
MSFETRQLKTFHFSSRAVRLPTTWLGSGQFLWKRPAEREIVEIAPLPLAAQFDIYRGSKEYLLRKSAEKALVAERIATYVNGLVANNPDEKQMYTFASIARNLGVTSEEVRSALPDGGYNGISFGVREEDRRALARFKTASTEK